MKNINDVLVNLDPILYSNIKNALYSIYKLDTESEEFKALKNEYSELNEALYVVSVNSNNSEGTIFLDAKGKVVLKAPFFANLLPYQALGFDIEISSFTGNHPLGKILNSNFKF